MDRLLYSTSRDRLCRGKARRQAAAARAAESGHRAARGAAAVSSPRAAEQCGSRYLHRYLHIYEYLQISRHSEHSVIGDSYYEVFSW